MATKQRHLALLRGINVGGKNRLPMEALRGVFTAAGCCDVETYIQSGNVVFSAPAKVLGGLAANVRAAISKQLDLEVPVVLRTGEELAAAVKNNPYRARDPAFLHLVFLADAPSPAGVEALDPDRSPPDAFTVRGQEIYLHCPNGLGRSKLTNAWFDSRLKTVSTVRNWRTVLELVGMTRAQAAVRGKKCP